MPLLYCAVYTSVDNTFIRTNGVLLYTCLPDDKRIVARSAETTSWTSRLERSDRKHQILV